MIDILRKRLSKRQLVLLVCLQFVLLGVALATHLLYGKLRTKHFIAAQAKGAKHIEIETKGVNGVTTIRNLRDLEAILESLRSANYFLPNHPRVEKEFLMRVHREDSTVDEYEIVFDVRGADHDYLNVVSRSGATTFYGSAFRTPGLRGPIILALATHDK
jgi:hypothetical protein